MSVEPRAPAITSNNCDAAPRPNASASGPEDVRMSCMVTTVPAPVTRANAAPIAAAAPSSSWSGTTPLMSYALKMPARSPNARPASRDTISAPRSVRAALPSLSVLRRTRAQHSQVTPAADLDALADRLGVEPTVRAGPRRVVHHRVGQRFQV